MKQRYPKLLFLHAFFALLFYQPSGVTAQCLCSDGTPALTEKHTLALTFPSNTTTPLTIPKFQASTGTLICVNAQIYLTTIVKMKFENADEIAVNPYVQYIRNDTLDGPGVSPSITGGKMKNYGPYPLAADDGNPLAGPDYVPIGPDTIYNNVLYEVTTSNVGSYLGTGNVSFNYRSTVTTKPVGSDNYALGVSSQNKLSFAVSYSYCNTIMLKLNLKNFQATLKDKENVVLSWTTQNESKNNNYEIQLSENGSSFRTIGTTSTKSADGVAAEYNYQHHIDQPVNGKRYYRIKQTNGKSTSYSDVRVVNLGDNAFPGLRMYPNPVVGNVNLEFDRPLNGEFLIELSNQVGQVVFSTRTRLNNSPTLQVQVSNPPPPGIYYLRAKDATSGNVYSGKLLFTK